MGEGIKDFSFSHYLLHKWFNGFDPFIFLAQVAEGYRPLLDELLVELGNLDPVTVIYLLPLRRLMVLIAANGVDKTSFLDVFSLLTLWATWGSRIFAPVSCLMTFPTLGSIPSS